MRKMAFCVFVCERKIVFTSSFRESQENRETKVYESDKILMGAEI